MSKSKKKVAETSTVSTPLNNGLISCSQKKSFYPIINEPLFGKKKMLKILLTA